MTGIKSFSTKKNENNETWNGKITKNPHKNKPFTQIEANKKAKQIISIIIFISDVPIDMTDCRAISNKMSSGIVTLSLIISL